MSWGTQPVGDFDELLNRVPKSALDSPRRSLVPLLDYWRDPKSGFDKLSAVQGCRVGPPVQLLFEHAVPVQAGRGKASFTDLMILGEETAVAVEAKHTEPKYKSTREWLRGEKGGNRHDVLRGWLGLISATTTLPLTSDSVLDLPYQLIHRTASVCFLGRPTASVVYLVFGEKSAPRYRESLSDFAELLGSPPMISFHLLSCTVAETDSYSGLLKRWDRGDRKLGDEVRNMLRRGPAFSFGPLKTLFSSLTQTNRI